MAGRSVLDRTNSTITIEDSGIGMTKNEIMNNLGTTISSFWYQGVLGGHERWRPYFHDWAVWGRLLLVNEDEQYIWESAAGDFHRAESRRDGTPGGGVKRDTKVTCYLKKSCPSFLEERRLKDLV